MQGVPCDVVGAYLALNRGITHYLLGHVTHQFPVDGGIESDLTQIQFHFHVCWIQSEGHGSIILQRPQFHRIEVHLDTDLHLGDQQLVEVKHFDVRYHDQGACHASSILGDFSSEITHKGLLLGGQGFKIGVRCRHVQLIGRPIVGPIGMIHPALWFQNGLSIISVEIQQSLQVGFVVIRVGLRTDEGVVESNADLLEEGMTDVVDQEGVFAGHHVPASRFLETQFDLKITARQIHVIFLRIDLKIDRVDPRGEGMNGHHAITRHAEIGQGHLE